MVSPELLLWSLSGRSNGLELRGSESDNSCCCSSRTSTCSASVSTNTFCNAFVLLGFAPTCPPLLFCLGFFPLAWLFFWLVDGTGSFSFSRSKSSPFFLFAGDRMDSVGWGSVPSAPSALRLVLIHHWPGGLLCLFPPIGLSVDELSSNTTGSFFRLPFVFDTSLLLNLSPVKENHNVQNFVAVPSTVR